MDEKLILSHMENLGISREDAIQLIADDLAIDRGEKLFDLDPELEKGAKQARQASSGERKPREKKADPDKLALIAALAQAVGVPVEIANAEREFTFTYNDIKYKVVLSRPRN